MKLYDELAEWWPLMSAPQEYASEAEVYRHLLLAHGDAPAHSLLELGSGGGNNACHLKQHFSMTLSDPSDGMLAHSRLLNPECEHVQADMRTLRLHRQFDRVFVHDAIGYMTSPSDLLLAMQTAFDHCRPGGAALFAPDCVRETFLPATDCGGNDGAARGLRYLEWTWDPDPAGCICITDYVYVMRQPDGSIRVEHDRHVEGLFPRDEWLGQLREAGFAPFCFPVQHEGVDHSMDVFIGVRPRID